MEFIGWIFGDKALLLWIWCERLQRKELIVRYLIGVRCSTIKQSAKKLIRLFWAGCHNRNRGRHWDRTRRY